MPLVSPRSRHHPALKRLCFNPLFINNRFSKYHKKILLIARYTQKRDGAEFLRTAENRT